jgi:RNA polymerase sigma factor for flagellar operon FliA
VKQASQRDTEAHSARNALTSPASSANERQPAEGSPFAAGERERLILEHLPRVRAIARRIHERLPDSVRLDDLISAGAVGLITAIDRFDPSRCATLQVYAGYRIRGAILDSLRGLDWAPRQQRKRHKQIEAAIAAAKQRLHRSPSEDEIAAQLGISIDEFHEWLVQTQGLNLKRPDAAKMDEEKSLDLLNSIVDDDKESWPCRIVERSELRRLLAEAISKMPDMERTVLSLYYYEELTMREISRVVRRHRSRITQLKLQAILRLRAYMGKRWPCPQGV